MSSPLFKATSRSNWPILLIFVLIIFMYVGTFLGMYDPESTRSMEEMMKMVPEGLAKAMGLGDIPSDLTGFLGNYFYGMLVFVLPLIYAAIMGNRLMARQVDNGSMAYLLSTPTARVRLALTQGVWFIASVAALFALLTGFTMLFSEASYPGALDDTAFVRLNVAAFLLTCAVSAVCWFFSCLFNEAKYSLAFGVGVPVLMYMLHMVAGIRESLGWIGSFSVYSLFRARDILSGTADVPGLCVIFAAATVVLFAAGIVIFKRKNLPL
jgi:ABC-2 type transport system permease protein